MEKNRCICSISQFFIMVFYNLPSFKSNALNYVSVEIINAKLEEPVKKEIIKPNRPEIKPLKKKIIPSFSI